MTITDLVTQFLTDDRPAGNILSEPVFIAQAIAATKFYAGFAEIESKPVSIDDTTELSLSEWALIRPLFLLYIEREHALQVEASGMMGITGFGRTSSEVSGDIREYELDMPHKAWIVPIFTV